MSDRSVIWVRDALVITFSIYVVVAVAMAILLNILIITADIIIRFALMVSATTALIVSATVTMKLHGISNT